MEPTSDVNSVSYFTRLKDCLCSTTAKEVAQYTALTGAFVASLLWIPIELLRGAAMAAPLFLAGNKVISGMEECPPRTRGQIALGLGISAGAGACAFAIHASLAPVLAPAGLALGLLATYNNNLLERYRELREYCCFSGGYRRMAPVPDGETFLAEDSATNAL